MLYAITIRMTILNISHKRAVKYLWVLSTLAYHPDLLPKFIVGGNYVLSEIKGGIHSKNVVEIR
jgi:hypothetical protein